MNKENEIGKSLQNGNEGAIEMLFRSHYKKLCNYAYTLLLDADESEEAVQQVFIRLWEKRDIMEINTSIQSYLYCAVRNTSLNKIKHNKVRKGYAEEVTAMAQQAEPATHITFQNELQGQIHSAIESLPVQCRLIFKLSRFEELKYSEIAEQLGISIKTVENQMGKALKIMRVKLIDYLAVILLLMASSL